MTNEGKGNGIRKEDIAKWERSEEKMKKRMKKRGSEEIS